MKPKSAEYDIGKDAHGRPVTLIVKRESADNDSWSIRIDPISQLDDKREITGLTEENLLAIAEIVMPASALVFREGQKALELPCLQGDTVFAFLEDAPKKKRARWHLSECIISEICISKDYEEPLFTAICTEKADFGRFFMGEFGKEIFTVEQYFALTGL